MPIRPIWRVRRLLAGLALTLPGAAVAGAQALNSGSAPGTSPARSKPAHASAGQALELQPIIVQVSPLSNAGIRLATYPQNVQTLSAHDLVVNGVANLTGALDKRATGVNLVNSQANPYQPTILYHGFEISPIQGTPAGLSVYVDGAPLQPAIWRHRAVEHPAGRRSHRLDQRAGRQPGIRAERAGRRC